MSYRLSGLGADDGLKYESVQVAPYVYQRLKADWLPTVMGILGAYRVVPVQSGPSTSGMHLVTISPNGTGESFLGYLNSMAQQKIVPALPASAIEALGSGTTVATAFFPNTALPEAVALSASGDEPLVVLFDPEGGWVLEEKKPTWTLAGMGVVGWSAVGAVALGAVYLARKRSRRLRRAA